jgi:hypothetical protein
MSEEARVWAKLQDAPCPMSKALLLELAAMSNMEGECWPSMAYLAKMFRVTARSVQRYIAKLREAGLILSEERARENGGQTSNLYRLPLTAPYRFDQAYKGKGAPRDDTSAALPHDTPVVPPHDNPVVPPTTPVSPPLEGETLTPKTSDEVSPRRREIEDAFDAWWELYPNKVERRAAAAIYDRIVRRREATADELSAGAIRYANRVRGRDAAMIKHPTTWLQRGCWVDEPAPMLAKPPSQHGLSRDEFAGPAELRSELVALMGEAWARSWIDDCQWDADGRRLIAKSPFRADRIRRDLGSSLSKMEVSIISATQVTGEGVG